MFEIAGFFVYNRDMRVKSEHKKQLRKDLGRRFRQFRETQEISQKRMAEMLGINRISLYRHEEGKWFPEYSILHRISEAFDLSMDWLLFNKGPVLYSQKEQEAKAAALKKEAEEKHDCRNVLKEEYRELLDYMERFPVLRYELLLQFQEFLRKQRGVQSPPITKEEAK